MGKTTSNRTVAFRSKRQASKTKDKNSLERRTEIGVFTLVAYEMLRVEKPGTGKKYTMLHVVWTGFNQAFREFFPDENPVECLDQMHKDGLIVLRVAPGGAVMCPTINLLTEPTEEERTIALRSRKFLTAFKAVRNSHPVHRVTKSGSRIRTSKEKQAANLFEDGDVEGALRKLGY